MFFMKLISKRAVLRLGAGSRAAAVDAKPTSSATAATPAITPRDKLPNRYINSSWYGGTGRSSQPPMPYPLPRRAFMETRRPMKPVPLGPPARGGLVARARNDPGPSPFGRSDLMCEGHARRRHDPPGDGDL